MTTPNNANYNSKSFNITKTLSQDLSDSFTQSESSSIQTLTNFYAAKLSNIKLIYLTLTFFITLLGIFVFIEHKNIIYKEFKVLYFYLLLSITYWPVSIFLAGLLILIKFLKNYFNKDPQDDDIEDSLVIESDNISLADYHSNNRYYSYIMGSFLFIILGFYIICIPASVYIIYNIFVSKLFFLQMKKYFNIFLFVFLNFSKSIAIASFYIYLLLVKYKSNRIKFELDEEFVRKIAEEVEQVKKCSGIFIADMDTIKRNEMFNRHTFSVQMPIIIEKKINSKLTQNDIKQKFDNYFPNAVNLGSVSANKDKNIEKQNSNFSQEENSQLGITPDKNKQITQVLIESPSVGEYANDNRVKFNFISKDTGDSVNQMVNVNDGSQINPTPDSSQGVNMSDHKNRIKNIIRARTMTGMKKSSLVYNMKKKFNVEGTDKIIREKSSTLEDDQNNLENNKVRKSSLVLHRISKNLQEYRNFASEQQLIHDSYNNISSSIIKDPNLVGANYLNKFYGPNSKSKDDMELIETRKKSKNEFSVGLDTEENKNSIGNYTDDIQRTLQFTE